MTTQSLSRWLLLLFVPLAIIGLVVWFVWPRPRDAVYSLYRERGRARTIEGLQGYNSQSSEHFEVYYTESDENVVDMILQNAEKVYGPVVEQTGFEPSTKVPLIVYSSRDELRKAFGWGSGESAMGVYWSGTIRLLSPNLWIDESNPRERQEVFAQLNPIAHELTHYTLDYLTNGNYPRWFTEGLAQRIEYKITGYLWLEEDSSLQQDLYTLEELRERFDDLENQPLAYRQSYLLVEYMERTYGEEQLHELVRLLSRGVGFNAAIEKAFGQPMNWLYADWLSWVDDNLMELDLTA